MTATRSHHVDPARGHHAEEELLLSVVIPTHDVEPWVDELLQSVLETPFPQMEVIVVDDHSTDGTMERLRELASADPRVHVVVAHERGGAGARNVGLALARGRYVAFADGDDIIPSGSYERLVASLEQSGSDVAFGDWLKFSSTRTWQPSKNWRVFDDEHIGVPVTDVPALIRGRAVWNKVFRRDFLVESAIEFPEVPRSNDIVPMTRAYLAAGTIDVLPDCVYLYRDRPGTGSMTSRAGAAAAAVSYFTQEAICAGLVADRADEGLSKTYSALVFDADSWLHLSRVLLQMSEAQLHGGGVVDAVRALVSRAPRSGLVRATPHKQLLWCLVAAGQLDLALRFNRLEEAARARGRYDRASLDVWVEATAAVVADADVLPEVQRERLVVEGLGRVVLHHARDLSRADADALTGHAQVAAVCSRIEVDKVRPRTLASVLRALRDGTPGVVHQVSVGRDVRLVADEVALQGADVVLGGPLPEDGLDGEVSVVLHRLDASATAPDVRVPAQRRDGRWSVRVGSGPVGVGRWELAAAFETGEAVVEVPVVTARMRLPEAARADLFRVLADRRRSWRVVLERRPAVLKRAVARLVARR